MIRIAIADDHEIVRKGLRLTIQSETDLELIGEARDGEEAVHLAIEKKPDVLIMDVQMPRQDGISAAAEVKRVFPECKILILTNYDQDQVLFSALKTQVDGFLLKDISGDDLIQAIRGVVLGKPQLHPEIARKLMGNMREPTHLMDALTEKERMVLRLIAHGLSNKEIGNRLFLSEVTIKGYVSAIFSKLYVSDRTQAALLAIRHGLVKPEEIPDSPPKAHND